MFFSSKNWNNGKQMDDIIPVSAALSFDKMRSSLKTADDLYLSPLIGDALMTTLEGLCDNETTDNERHLIRLLRSAEANLAFYANFDTLQLRITDQGFQRQQTENFGSPYKYQEDRLRAAFRNRGFNALDSILDLLDASFTSLAGYGDMPARCTSAADIVQRTSEVNAVHFINGSRLVFLRLVPQLVAVAHNELRPLIGWNLYNNMTAALQDGTAEERVGDTDPSRTYEELRQYCIPFVVKKAVARLIRETGSLTDRGLYFLSHVAGSSDNDTAAPASRREAHDAAANAETEARQYGDTLMAFIEWKWPDYFPGKPSDTFKRDNNGKKTFWA